MVRSDVRAIDEKSHELSSGMTCRTRCVQISYKNTRDNTMLDNNAQGEARGKWKMYTLSMNEETLIDFYASGPLTIDFGINAGCLGPGRIMMGRW